MIRSVLPPATALLLVLGALRWQGERMGLYGTTFGIGLMTVAVLVVGVGLMCFVGLRLERGEEDRLLADEELRRSSRYFELSRDLICTAGFDGYFKQLNPAWTEALGWSEAELRSRPFVEFVHPEDRETTERESAALGEGGVVDLVNRYATNRGGWRWIEWRAMGLVDEGLIYASARDVTQAKLAELALEASELQTRQILESAHDAFISTDADGLITEWNTRAEASFGWSRREALGRELAATVFPEAHRQAHRDGIEQFLATGQERTLGKRLELTALHRDGREFPVELTISPLRTKASYTFNVFLRDITERTRAQQELALARDQALEASRLKSMFVANVSHEIRTPMNGVIGMSELLLDTELDEWQREYAETIAASGDTLLGIIDDILDFSKIEAGKLELDPTDVDLRHAVERACGMLAARAHKKGLELVVAVDPGVPALVRADAARLRQVIANLVLNAIKFTPAGEIVVRAHCTSGDDGASLLRIEVADTGIGIERKALERLFTPFAQADSSTTRNYGGTGLGLAISRQLIELMGGSLGATSEPGEGSTFWFELTLASVESDAGTPEKEREIAGLRVLIVDDNATSRTILARQLSSWQMSCDVADSAAQALERLDAAADAGLPYPLALIDKDMPGVDGYELAHVIRERPALSGIMLVLLSSSGGAFDAPEEAIDGFDGLITKPVRQSRLYEELQAVIAGERPAGRQAREPVAVDEAPRREFPHVLVVEDTPVNQAVVARMLEKNGYEAHIAENGRKALEAMAVDAYAVVLMDCQMPELDGYETTREIRRREGDGPRIPIIAMTANSMQGERERCLAAGMDDYLSKPLRNRVLKEALERWVPDAIAAATRAPAPAAPPEDAASGADAGRELLNELVIADLEGLEGDILPELLALYFDQSTEHLGELSEAIASVDVDAVRKTAHKLKGSSLTLGAAHVSHVAAELETVAKAGGLSGADAMVVRLRDALGTTRAAFADRSERSPAGAKHVGSPRASMTG